VDRRVGEIARRRGDGVRRGRDRARAVGTPDARRRGARSALAPCDGREPRRDARRSRAGRVAGRASRLEVAAGAVGGAHGGRGPARERARAHGDGAGTGTRGCHATYALVDRRRAGDRGCDPGDGEYGRKRITGRGGRRIGRVRCARGGRIAAAGRERRHTAAERGRAGAGRRAGVGARARSGARYRAQLRRRGRRGSTDDHVQRNSARRRDQDAGRTRRARATRTPHAGRVTARLGGARGERMALGHGEPGLVRDTPASPHARRLARAAARRRDPRGRAVLARAAEALAR
jgi:hypothetical protein